jgi:PAS domain S-box-containing protein
LAQRFWQEAPDAAIAVGADGRIVFWNHAAEVIFGYPATEAIGQSILRAPHERSAAPS